MLRIYILFFLLAAVGTGHDAYAQRRASVAFWNVENLYDTIPDSRRNDRDYTPDGRLGWNTERYRNKLQNLARVIGNMNPDVLGLAEVENETALRDLVNTLREDYNYIHFESGDRRGIDLALIYKGDRFFPERQRLIKSHTGRQFLLVRGALLDEEINILVCHLPSKLSTERSRERAMQRLAEVADSLQANDSAKLIVMGDFNCDPSERLFRRVFGENTAEFYHDRALYGAVRGGNITAVSYAWDGSWSLLDNILICSELATPPSDGGIVFRTGSVFVRDYMLFIPENGVARKRAGYPIRTFTSGRYTGGFSDHLPVYIILER